MQANHDPLAPVTPSARTSGLLLLGYSIAVAAWCAVEGGSLDLGLAIALGFVAATCVSSLTGRRDALVAGLGGAALVAVASRGSQSPHAVQDPLFWVIAAIIATASAAVFRNRTAGPLSAALAGVFVMTATLLTASPGLGDASSTARFVAAFPELWRAIGPFGVCILLCVWLRALVMGDRSFAAAAVRGALMPALIWGLPHALAQVGASRGVWGMTFGLLLGVAAPASLRFVTVIRENPAGAVKRLVPYIPWMFFALVATHYFVEVRDGGDNWKTADWLITYLHGPVRRGLIGTLMVGVANLGLPLPWIVYVVQTAVYAAIFALVIRLYTRQERHVVWMAVLLSPAFLLFPYWTPEGGFRKEILAFLALAGLCAAYGERKISTPRLAAVCGAFVLAAFSHEVAAFTVPFFLYVLYRARAANLLSVPAARLAGGVIVAGAAAAIAFALAFPADARIVELLCEPLRSQGFRDGICNGALAWLDKPPAFAFREKNIDLLPYSATYLTILGIAVAPMAFISWRGRARLAVALVGFLAIAALSLVAIDWGRWLHVYVFCLFCVVLAESAIEPVAVRPVPILLVLFYVTTWNVTLCCTHEVGNGLVAVLRARTQF